MRERRALATRPDALEASAVGKRRFSGRNAGARSGIEITIEIGTRKPMKRPAKQSAPLLNMIFRYNIKQYQVLSLLIAGQKGPEYNHCAGVGSRICEEDLNDIIFKAPSLTVSNFHNADFRGQRCPTVRHC
jgi:hypothetical protein